MTYKCLYCGKEDSTLRDQGINALGKPEDPMNFVHKECWPKYKMKAKAKRAIGEMAMEDLSRLVLYHAYILSRKDTDAPITFLDVIRLAREIAAGEDKLTLC